MTSEVAMRLGPGDILLCNEDVFRVAGYPEMVVYQKRKTVRVPVRDAFGRTQVLVREDIRKSLRKSGRCKSGLDKN
jgi:hypothetical protein